MWKKASLWSFVLRRMAKAQGFLDPVAVLSSLQRFAKPAEVWVPTELLRLGAILQARGLINSQAIQHNLDWVWPFWVNCQFNPQDKGFIPRAFSISHINLTHRNWTALGVPDFEELPLVDPRGLVTPFMDGWSIDVWIISEEYGALFPSRLQHVHQEIDYWNTIRVDTISEFNGMKLKSQASVEMVNGIPTCKVSCEAEAPGKAWLAVCVRPYNPEGVSFIYDICQLDDPQDGWQVNKAKKILLMDKPDRYVFSNYHWGDLSQLISLDDFRKQLPRDIACPVGMASSAAVYDLEPAQSKRVTVNISLADQPMASVTTWDQQLEGHCELQVPDKKFQFLYEMSLRTLILHSPGDIYPGPFTYKRFWFRDAAFILNAMMTLGLMKNVEKIIDRFSSRQRMDGYFMSQDGEWDSNGQAIWTMERYSSLTGRPIKPEWMRSIIRGAKWIQKKRIYPKETSAHMGLLPAGFSAEHFGPNDYYYWDDFWGVAGLKAAAAVVEKSDYELAQTFQAQSADLMRCVEESLGLVELRLKSRAVPASPYRRMDTGAIGSMMASYPLQLWDSQDERVTETSKFLLERCFLRGAFYHEISHSGLNAYLTLHVAQTLLRAGNIRFFEVMKAVADLATPTGQWPEAIHPHTLGGCMGDGQHVWASAEWLAMMRNMFVREEENIRTVILCSGIPEHWLEKGETLKLGFTSTIYGKISVQVICKEQIKVIYEAQWHDQPPTVDVRLPGYAPVTLAAGQTEAMFKREDRMKVFKNSDKDEVKP